MRRCRWVRVEGHGMVRLREGEVLFFADGRVAGVARIMRDYGAVAVWGEAFLKAAHARALIEPEWEVFS